MIHTTEAVETKPLISVRQAMPVREAARLMADASISAVGVLDPFKRFVGIFTERDLTWMVAQGRDLETTRIGEVANDFPVIVEGPINRAAAIARMTSAHIRHLIVRVDGSYRIVSMRDLL